MNQNNIKNWLEDFKACWIDKDIDNLMSLFSDNVEYYETPFQKLVGREKVSEVWQEIKDQDNINIEFELYCTDNNKYVVKWKLNFKISDRRFDYRGIYLIELDSQDMCCSFYQCSYDGNQ